jgi:hypothetical protein
MLAIFRLIAAFITNLFKSRRRLEAENLFLRHQLNIAVSRCACHCGAADCTLLVWMTRFSPAPDLVFQGLLRQLNDYARPSQTLCRRP